MANQIGGTIIWNLDVDSKKFDDGISSAKTKLGEFGNELDKAEKKTLSASEIMSKAAQGIATGFKEIGTAGLALGAGFIAFATKAAFSASRIDELTLALHAIGKANGITASQTDDAVTALRKNNIAYADSLQITSRFIQNELKLSDAIKLSNTAKDLAIIAGVGSSDATNMLTEAISGQSVIALRQFGIVTTLDDAYTKYGDTIGKGSQDLTEAEKKQALLNTVLEAGAKVVGTYDAAQLSSGKQFRSFTTRILPDFIAQIGRAFEPSLVVIVQSITKAVQGLSAWFDANKATVKAWGDQLAGAVTIGLSFIKKLFDFLIANPAIVQGALTALVMGVGFLAGAFIIAHGAAIILFGAITGIVTLFGGLEPILTTISNAFKFLGDIFTTYIKPSLDSLWSTIQTQLLPQLQKLWDLVSPVLIPVLKFLALVLGVILLGAIIIVIEIVKSLIQWVSDSVKRFNDFVEFIKTIPGTISSAFSTVYNAITQPFKDAWETIKDIAGKIKSELEKISPFHRNSPSLVDNVLRGVDIIKDQYASLTDIKLPAIAHVMPSMAQNPSLQSFSPPRLSLQPAYDQARGGRSGPLVNVEHMEVRDQSDITDVARELGFRIELSSGYTDNG